MTRDEAIKIVSDACYPGLTGPGADEWMVRVLERLGLLKFDEQKSNVNSSRMFDAAMLRAWHALDAHLRGCLRIGDSYPVPSGIINALEGAGLKIVEKD